MYNFQSRDRNSIAEDSWSQDCPRTLEDLEAALQARKEAALKRERSLASAFSDQVHLISFFLV